jgi:2-methylisocitrate lyase-like PEP mutase family enzyme
VGEDELVPEPTFSDLHHADRPLVLPNAWDVPSALAFVDAGFAAVGSTSFGVASSIGRPDGGRSTGDANRLLARALSALPCHLSMDVEDGYSDDPGAVADYVAGLPVAGINIEDSTAEALLPPQALSAKIAAVKARVPGLFVNARVDTYWLHQDESVEATLERALAYVDAGADGVFFPGATEPDVLRRLTAALPVPVNVLMTPGRSLDELAALGVRRVSTGSLPYRAAVHAATAVAVALREGTTPPQATPYPDLQARLKEYERTSR